MPISGQTPWGHPNPAFLALWLFASCFCALWVPPHFSSGDPSYVAAAVALLLPALAAIAEGPRWRSPAPFFFVGAAAGFWLVFNFAYSLAGTEDVSHVWTHHADGAIGVLAVLSFCVVGWALLCRFVADVAQRRSRDRADCGRCADCGYSLRGLPEKRCPECGTPF